MFPGQEKVSLTAMPGCVSCPVFLTQTNIEPSKTEQILQKRSNFRKNGVSGLKVEALPLKNLVPLSCQAV
jgi:hypothetical protein